MYSLKDFDKQRFLSEFWQKKPCVIRKPFLHFADPLDEHELAGLAQEADIDSRVIYRNGNNWQLTHGPIDDFSKVCQGQWTLLVQSVDRYVENANSLMASFNFVPHWRKDDLMVSFSVEGAGVGPHLDQYDVFIIQGKGRRHWKVGDKGVFVEQCPAAGLRQIEGFTPIIDEILQPGDVIYIPPGYPHDGVALEPCLNYSVGFRAPTQAELLSDFADYCLQSEAFSRRFTDPNLGLREYPTGLKADEIEQFRGLMQSALSDAQFDHWLGEFLSKSNHIDGSEPLVEVPYTERDIKQMISEGTCFTPALHIKPLIMEKREPNSENFSFFIEGQQFVYPEKQRKNVELLLNSACWPQKTAFNEDDCLFFNHLLSTLVNAGFWYPA